jgi:hypothetical protein
MARARYSKYTEQQSKEVRRLKGLGASKDEILRLTGVAKGSQWSMAQPWGPFPPRKHRSKVASAA